MAQGKGLDAVRRRLRLSRRAWRIIGIVAAVVVLAAIVFISAALSKPKTTQSPEVKAVAQQMESETLTDQGLGALSKNDTATAETLLKRAVALNPNNKRAAVALTQIRQSTTAPPDTGGTSSTGTNGGTSTTGGNSNGGSTTNPNTPASGPWDKKIDLAKLLPVTANGYTMYPPQVSGTDAQVSGDPPVKGVRVLWAVHDRGTSAAAAKFVTNVSKRAYAKDAIASSIDGASGYLGTDGSRYATAVYVRGRYVFEVIVSLATPSGDVKQALPIAREAAVAFPDQP